MATVTIGKSEEGSLEVLKKLKAERTVLRRQFSARSTTLLTSLKEETRDEGVFLFLSELYEDLHRLDNEILSLTTDVKDEVERQLEYRAQWAVVRAAWRRGEVSDADDGVSESNSAASSSQHRAALPKLKFRPYDGSLKNYLQFWGQFKKYHEDANIPNEDKFEFLLNVTKEGSTARFFLERFPPGADTYEEAFAAFQERFGDTKRLQQLYVRELVGMVLQRSTDVNLVSLYDNLQSQLRSLSVLGVTRDQLNTLLFPLVEMVLPPDILTVWERQISNQSLEFAGDGVRDGETSEMDRLLMFLKQEANRTMNSEARQQLETAVIGAQDTTPTARSLVITGRPASGSCIFCQKEHPSEKCFKARKMSASKVREVLMETKRCLKCMKASHFAANCTTKLSCRHCNGAHHSLLCSSPSKADGKKIKEKSDATSLYTSCDSGYLQSLLVKVKRGGSWITTRALFDSGSQKSYITSGLAGKLDITPVCSRKIRQGLFGGQTNPPKDHLVYDLQVTSVQPSTAVRTVRVLTTDVICRDVPRVGDSDLLSELRKEGITLSDSGTGVGDVELLIGADYYGKFLTGNKYETDSGPVAMETILGWTILGGTPEKQPLQANVVLSSLCLKVTCSDLWTLDAIGITDPVATVRKQEISELAIKTFNESVKFKEGRYEVMLPWLEGHPIVESNRPVALRRLESVTKKLRQEKLLEAYDNTLQEWLDDGVIEPAPCDSTGLLHYLPHRAVVKKGPSSFKVRPVFDGSAKGRNNVSLNDCLEKGPNLIESVPAILNRFRQGTYGCRADIKRAFLQIAVCDADRDTLRFLWWDQSGKVTEFRHCRVVFGLTSSPFHLGATIAYHLQHAPVEFAETVEKLKVSFYVDDCVTSVSSVSALNTFKDEATEIMNAAKFELVGWEHTDVTDAENVPTAPDTTVLGVIWNTQTDLLSCKVPHCDKELVLTKRNLLSKTQAVFDPVGVLAPNLLVVKLLVQAAWAKSLKWDDELPQPIASEFTNWCEGLPLLSQVKIPRCFGVGNDADATETLHVFCDASKDAYATAIFLRTYRKGQVKVQLVQAKARVAPMEPKVSIPRLELLAALIGARLYHTVVTDLQWGLLPVYCWTDSMVVLSWLSRPNDWQTFVSNRVREILTHTKFDFWRHVPGVMNPADLPSRGCSAQQLLIDRWWEGPKWLLGPEESWPHAVVEYTQEVDIERKKSKVQVLLSHTTEVERLFLYFSSFTKLVRMVAFMFRFVRRAQGQSNAPTLTLSVDEVEQAENALFKYVQKTSLTEKHLEGVTSTEQGGILKVTSRVVNDDLSRTHLILLPGKHILVDLMISEEHRKQGHAGILTLLTILRKRYWITQGRASVKRVLSKCGKCRRFNAQAACPPFAPLPTERTNTGKAFESTGVDAFGPLHTRDAGKVWGIIFTCCVYRAVHLEIVNSLSTESFILAARRFMARRGRVRTYYSDNGTNFVGCINLLSGVDWLQIDEFSQANRIRWIRNPPTASWYGGHFERLISCVKNALKRSLGNAVLSLEELTVAFCDAEALVNSRPLTYVGEDPCELKPLTPSLFLQDACEYEMPDFDEVDRTALSRRAKHLAGVRDDLRRRIREEYLSLLVQKGSRRVRGLTVGDVVLVGSDDKRRMDWPLGLIVEVYPGRDGNVRVAKVKVSNGFIIRPFQRLYPLEISQSESSNSQVENEQPAECVPDDSVDMTPEPKPAIVLESRTKSGRCVKVPEKLNL